MAIILILLVFLSFIFTMLFYSETDNWFGKISSSIITILCFIAMAIYFNTPKAIDVYKGKTTLEITYKDNIAIDSTVVFK